MRFNFKQKINYLVRQDGLKLYMANKVELINYVDNYESTGFSLFEGYSYEDEKYTTTILVDFNSITIKEFSCTCSQNNNTTPCKHAFAFHLLINNIISKKYIDKNTKMSFDDVIASKSVTNISKELSTISKRNEKNNRINFMELVEDIDLLKEKINIDIIFVEKNDKIYDFQLKITSINANYTLKKQKILDFTKAVNLRKNFYFGKKLTYKPDFFYFDDFGMELLNILHSNFTCINETHIVTKALVHLMKEFNRKSFYLIKENEDGTNIETIERKYFVLQFNKIKDFKLSFIDDNTYEFSHNMDKIIFLFENDYPEFIKIGDHYFYVTSNKRQAFRKFMILFNKTKKIQISKDEFQILQKLILDFKKYFLLKIDNEITFDIYEEQIKPIFLLSLNNSFFKSKHLICEIDFQYKNSNKHRNFYFENEIINFVKDQGFFVYDKRLFYDLGDNSQESIYKIYSILNERGSVFLNKKAFQIKNISNYSINVNKNPNRLLEIDFSVDGMDRKSFQKFMLSNENYFFNGESMFFLDKSTQEAEKLKQISNYLEIFEDKNKIVMNENQYAIGEEIFDLSYKLKDNFLRKFNEIDFSNVTVPKELETILREYQKEGFSWLSKLDSLNCGGILADDMGLGKTIQAISYIVKNKDKGKFLIIAPSSLIYNWANEINKFGSNLKTLILNEESNDRAKLLKGKNYDVIVTSYGILSRDIENISKINFYATFLDEAQKIKNPSSLSHKASKKIKSKNKFCLTGTPIENNLIELWSLFDFVLPGYLFSLDKFKTRFIRDDSNNQILHNIVKPFILRRTKSEILTELPDKIYENLIVPLYEEEKMIYKSVIDDMHNSFTGSNKIEILSLLTRLKQICCHPKLIDGKYKNSSSKLDLFSDIIQNAIDSGHRVLVFSQFTSMLEILSDTLNKQKIDFFTLTGATKSKNRMEMVDKFNEGEKSVFLISLKAGGTGLNLTGADVVIHYDQWWNPAVEEQATDRAYRIGQNKNVQVIRLISKGTIEEKIQILHKEKKNLVEQIISTNGKNILSLSIDEIKNLIKLDELL